MALASRANEARQRKLHDLAAGSFVVVRAHAGTVPAGEPAHFELKSLKRDNAEGADLLIVGAYPDNTERRDLRRGNQAEHDEVVRNAIEDAGLKPTDIDGVIPYGQGGAVAEDFITNFGIPDLRFSATTPMGGASAVASIQCAIAAIGAGI